MMLLCWSRKFEYISSLSSYKINYTRVDEKEFKNTNIQNVGPLFSNSRFFQPNDLKGSPMAHAASPTALSPSKTTSPNFKTLSLICHQTCNEQTILINIVRYLFQHQTKQGKKSSLLYQRRSKWPQNGRYTPTLPLHQSRAAMRKTKVLKDLGVQGYKPVY